MAEPPTIPFRTTGSRLLHHSVSASMCRWTSSRGLNTGSSQLGPRLPTVVKHTQLSVQHWKKKVNDILHSTRVNFAVCQLFALFAAFWFRLYLSPSRAGVVVRHVVITMLGIYFAIFCFGWYSLHIFIEVSLCYCIMITANVSNIHRYSFVAAMGYLTLCQISRVYIFNYGLLATDFSGPLMIVTQKITSLAFQMHDGLGRKEEELTVEQRRLAVSSRPTLLEYCSYHLNFLGILAGPASNYKDYIAFIEGNHIDMKLIEEHWKQKGFSKFPDPSPLRAVANKMVITFVCLVWFTLITKNFPISYNVDDKFISEASFFRKLCYLFLSVHASRPKYYFAWTLADAVNNAGGFGFNGLDKNGNLRWDLISNLNIWNIEIIIEFKIHHLPLWDLNSDHRNIIWVSALIVTSVCYDRAPYFPTALTFILSALWHGVYPGYYFTFTTAILITLAARTMRSNFRHYFLSSRKMKIGYDVMTWVFTQLALCYIVTPFLLLGTEPTIKFYKSIYFHFHILCAIVLPILAVKKRKSIMQTTSLKANSSNPAPSHQQPKKEQ